MGVLVALDPTTYESLETHLHRGDAEQLAFLRAHVVASEPEVIQLTDLFTVPPEDFEYHGAFHISLKDEMRPRVIQWAWAENSGLAEAHSHHGDWPACFSPTDLEGLREFVPHARWRLGQAPYIALVFARGGFDGLAWTGPSHDPAAVECLRIDGIGDIKPSGLTWERLRGDRQ